MAVGGSRLAEFIKTCFLVCRLIDDESMPVHAVGSIVGQTGSDYMLHAELSYSSLF